MVTSTWKTKVNSAFKVENTRIQTPPLTTSKRFIIDNLFRWSYNSPRKYKQCPQRQQRGRGKRKSLMGRKLIMWSFSNSTRSNKFPVCFPSVQPLNVPWHVDSGDLPSLWFLAVSFSMHLFVYIQLLPSRVTTRWQVSSIPLLRFTVIQSFTPRRWFNQNREFLFESDEWFKSSL